MAEGGVEGELVGFGHVAALGLLYKQLELVARECLEGSLEVRCLHVCGLFYVLERQHSC